MNAGAPLPRQKITFISLLLVAAIMTGLCLCSLQIPAVVSSTQIHTWLFISSTPSRNNHRTAT